MTDLQWKIEDGELLVYRKCGTVTTTTEGTKPYFDWLYPTPRESARIVAATQEKCAQVADEHAKGLDNEWNRKLGISDELAEMGKDIASAIRALNMETGQ